MLDHKLQNLLRSLSPDDWQHPTLARQWTVKDVAAHLLAGNLQTLSMLRDGYFGEAPDVPSYAGIVAYLNRLNADWVRAARRLSPAVLVELLVQSGAEYTAYLHTLDPWAPAVFSVAWAGEAESKNWFHVARDYTEKWHHQQQIREAVGQTTELLTPALYRPFLDTLLCGLPHALRDVPAPAGAVVQVCVTSASGGVWETEKTAEGWQLRATPVPGTRPTAEVELAPEMAWKVFTKGINPADAAAQMRGDTDLSAAVLRLVAVMA
ncbi:maleylpyruvate isomerase N-terminal domain-containing protein [Hymenobacter canadensis]|uniref:Maleylpyruvate isomerase N-terminal domain-containing protein n=1 Tax=Hymenobacter canadensis TaxID=2999067 RepID=A0ABY7LZK8_9BACT|nr:maleylpyruvate isomerase N-terminal domain-containing protein [Hymenobacter canadensis]WBA44190.1 maleylpyruvate isomerase N-terminal domain-containing protein [Hymenobacter canadensis]